jgi:hypothetical protein
MRGFIAVSIGIAAFPSLSSASPFTDIISAMSEGDWAKVNINHYSDVWTPIDQRPTGNNPGAIIRAWSSFAWDSTRNELILWGGGHANYGGNEVYTWKTSTLEWARASLPSAIQHIAGTANGFQTVDGPLYSPISAHTYDNQEYLPVVDRFVTLGGNIYNSGGPFRMSGATTGPYLWDPSKADANQVGGLTGSQVDPAAHPGVIGGEMWENRLIGLPPNTLPVNGATDAVVVGGTDVVYFSAVAGNGTIGGLYKYTINDINDPAADTWQAVGRGTNGSVSAGSGAGALDVDRNLFVRTVGSTGFMYWDLNEAGLATPHVFTPTVDGIGGSLALGGRGLEWDPVRDWFVLWMGNGDVWYLKPPDEISVNGWLLEKALDPSGATPLVSDNTAFTGVLGKWKYDATDDVFIGLSGDIDGGVWVYKPFGWQGALVVASEPWSAMILAGGLGIMVLWNRRGRMRHEKAASA